MRKLEAELKSSARVNELLSLRKADGRIPFHPYSKWYGAHWVLAMLAELGYPRGDRELLPLREQVFDWLFSPSHLGTAHKRAGTYAGPIRKVGGRARMHASMEGSAIFYLLKLGLDDSDGRIEALVERLLSAQWPDGGWNCDRRAAASVSSFTETLLPLRGLIRYTAEKGGRRTLDAVRQASEYLLGRQLYRRISDGSVIRNDFVLLHYPCYWHYDILFGLKVMCEGGYITDKRCSMALDVLTSKALRAGFPAEKRYYAYSANARTGRSTVRWGPTGRTRPNDFVTADAMSVLKMAGRLMPKS